MSAAPRIQVLSPELANQIAAGEVVERPASVVKELCENALDARAGRIEVEIADGGRKLVRVTDDGCGMTPEEVRLSLLRHATSKLRSAEELSRLSTLGFRGEALPAIAAVSRVTLTTRVGEAVAGYQLAVEAGLDGDGHEVGAPVGTRVEVRDLFFNTPARLKFQKARGTETANVSDALLRLALTQPSVHFRLRVDDRLVLDLPPHHSLGERVIAALGRKRRRFALVDDCQAGVRVQAFLASPEESQNSSRACYLFANQRPIRDRNLLYALTQGYGPLLPRGRYPVAMLAVTVAAEQLDVNVHPQKLEVRFARLPEVLAVVRHAITTQVRREPWLGDGLAARAVRVYPMAAHAPHAVAPTPSAAEPAASYAAGQPAAPTLPFPEPAPASRRDGDPPPGSWFSPANQAVADTAFGTAAATGATTAAGRTTAGGGTTAPGSGYFSRLKFLGQLERTYLVCEGQRELVLIDQHAAHERVAFHRLRQAHAQARVRSQQLLFPDVLELPPAELAAASEHIALLSSLGFEIEPFGGQSVAVRAIPEQLRDGEMGPVLRDLLAELAAGQGQQALSDKADALLACVACHSVLRAGDLCTPEMATALLASLDSVDLRAHCPHGRPAVLRIPVSELARRFGRT